MENSTEERRVATEIISTLAHIKVAMVDFILKPAGIPADVYQPLMALRDEATGQPISKRQLAPLILDAIEKRPDCQGAVRRLIEIASRWSNFHLADKEFTARATVQKAREVLGTIQIMEEREAKQRETARIEEHGRLERDRAEQFRKQCNLLLMMFDTMATSNDPQRRGYLLQDLLNRIFDLNQIPLARPYTRNDGAEQIDGAFKVDGWHYIVECRWRQKLADIRELDGLKGQVDRSGKQTMGFFLSINGWSENVPGLLKQNPDKNIVLMDGFDLRTILSSDADLHELILAKVTRLNLEAEPFLGVKQYLNERKRH